MEIFLYTAKLGPMAFFKVSLVERRFLYRNQQIILVVQFLDKNCFHFRATYLHLFGWHRKPFSHLCSLNNLDIILDFIHNPWSHRYKDWYSFDMQNFCKIETDLFRLADCTYTKQTGSVKFYHNWLYNMKNWQLKHIQRTNLIIQSRTV